MTQITQLHTRNAKGELKNGENTPLNAGNQSEIVTKEIAEKYLKIKGINNFTTEQAILFIEICQIQQLNPFLNEIYAVPHFNKKYNTYTVTPVVSYDVYLSRASLSGVLDGHEIEITKAFDDETKRFETYATCTVWRKDRSRPTKATVKLSEYTTNKSLWLTKPETMLKKVAMSHAYRHAFPEFLKGVPYTRDEMTDIETVDISQIESDKVKAKSENEKLDALKNELIDKIELFFNENKKQIDATNNTNMLGSFIAMRNKSVSIEFIKSEFERIEKNVNEYNTQQQKIKNELIDSIRILINDNIDVLDREKSNKILSELNEKSIKKLSILFENTEKYIDSVVNPVFVEPKIYIETGIEKIDSPDFTNEDEINEMQAFFDRLGLLSIRYNAKDNTIIKYDNTHLVGQLNDIHTALLNSKYMNVGNWKIRLYEFINDFSAGVDSNANNKRVEMLRNDLINDFNLKNNKDHQMRLKQQKQMNRKREIGYNKKMTA